MRFWRKQPKLEGYVSEIDQFLQEFDVRMDADSASRRAEEIKYERIKRLLTNSNESPSGTAKTTEEKVWEDF